MKSVHFLTNDSPIVYYFNTPVRFNIWNLYDRGYRIRFFRHPTEKAMDADFLILISHHILRYFGADTPILCEDSRVVEFLKQAKKYTHKIIWMDTRDSTGVTHFEILPYVDLYLKKHLLRDKTLYQKAFYGGRIFTDYYHKRFGIIDTEPFRQFYPLPEDQAHKVGLSWNMGMGDVVDAFSIRNAVRRRMPRILPYRYKVRYTDPRKKRDLDIFMRANANMHRETVAFHRKELIRRLESLLRDDGTLKGSVSGKIPLRKYRRQLQNAKLAFGPFGWGELNIREYEALIFGCLLLRPDISHMETWPEIFRADETCVAYQWDFSDLESKVRALLHDTPRRIQIAENGQDAYRESISSKGMEAFCDWFAKQIEL